MKNNLSTLLLTFIFVLGCTTVSRGQDPQFTQFYANPLYLNPAFAGTGMCPRITMNYRNEWPGLNTTPLKTFITYSASYDQHIHKLSGGVGLLVTNDRAGIATLNTTNVSLIYSYQLPVSRKFSIRAALQATYMQKQLDWTKLTFGDMIDPRRGFIYETNEVPHTDGVNTADFSAGVIGFSKNYFFGAAFHHITQPNEALIAGERSPLPMKITGHAGAVIPLESSRTGSESSISPNILYQYQAKFTQMNLGMYFTKSAFVGGLWYRNKDAFIVLIGMQNDVFKFGYSYDVTISSLSLSATAGSHEISFGLKFECKPPRKRFRTVSCPSF